MSRTHKDYKNNKKWDNRMSEHKSGVHKEFKKRSARKMRRTRITSTVVDMEYSDEEITLRIPRNVIKGAFPQDKEIKVTITVAKPRYVEVENMPRGLDPMGFS